MLSIMLQKKSPPSPWLWAIATLIFCCLFVSLGFWQLARAKEKEILQDQFAVRLKTPPVTINQLPTDSTIRYHPVMVTGHYDNTHNILLDNKIHNHHIGYEVLTAFIPDNHPRVVLINRGWIPAGSQRNKLPTLPPATATTLTGYVYVPIGKPFTLGKLTETTIQWPLRMQALNLDAISTHLALPIFPWVVLLSPNAPDGFIRDWKPINMPSSKHLGYAVQWFSFAAVLILIFVGLNFRNLTMPKKPFWILTAIVLLFAVPLLLAALLLHQGTLDKSLPTTNHGQLIIPPLDLANLRLHDAQTHLITPSIWKGRWLLLYINPNSSCDTSCEKKMYNLRQIRSATGKDQSRLQRAILTFNNQSDDPHLAQLLNTQYVGTLHFKAAAEDINHFLGNAGAAKLALTQGSIYLVDPHGNVLMYYSADADSMGIFKDITRLLKLSKIG